MAALIIRAVVSIPVPLSGVHAQPPPPFTAYGVGLTPGVTVAALVNGAICDNSIAGNEGRWVIHFGSDAPCLPTERNLVGFTINGVAAEQTELYRPGGSPADLENGIALTAAADIEVVGTIPVQGIGLITWGGGTLNQLAAQVRHSGCLLRSVWANRPDGRLVGVIIGAPSFVNREWHDRFPGTEILASTPLLLVSPQPDSAAVPAG